MFPPLLHDLFFFTEKRMKPHPMIDNYAQDLSNTLNQGLCNDELNIPECSYDGNDCCRYSDPQNGNVNEHLEKHWYDENNIWYNTCETCTCIDPCLEFKKTDAFKNLFPNYNIDEYDRSQLGDGICQSENNFNQCEYDKTDCCPRDINDKCDGISTEADSQSKCDCKSGEFALNFV